MPAFVEPQLCKLVERPPSQAGWAHEIKFDGYRLQLRVEDGKARLRTRKGLDWTEKFPAIAEQARDAARLHDRRRGRWRSSHGAPDFAALQAALSEGQTGRPGLLRLRSAVRRRRGPARPAAARAQGAPEGAARRAQGQASRPAATSSISRRRATRCWNRPAAWTWKASSPSELDAPYRSGRGDSWIKTKCRAGHEVVIGGWTSEGERVPLAAGRRASRTARPELVHVGRVGTGFSEAGHAQAAAAAARASRARPARSRPAPPAQGSQHALGAARAGGRDRVRRLDRRRQCAPGRLQGPARRQAGRGGRGRGSRCKPEKAKMAKPVPEAKRAKSSGADNGRRPGGRHGRDDLQSRQAAVARRDSRPSPSSSWRATTRRSATG